MLKVALDTWALDKAGYPLSDGSTTTVKSLFWILPLYETYKLIVPLEFLLTTKSVISIGWGSFIIDLKSTLFQTLRSKGYIFNCICNLF